MLLIRDLLPDFPEVQPNLFVNVLGVRAFNVCFMYKDKKSDEPRPVEQPLFGAVIDPAYVAPRDNEWQDDDATAIVVAHIPIQAPEAVDPEVERLEGSQEQDAGSTEDSSEGLKLLMNVALKGKRKLSELEGDKSSRRTRSATRQLLIKDVDQNVPQVETLQPQGNEQVSIPAEEDTVKASDCLETTPTTTEPGPSSVPSSSSKPIPKRKRRTSNMDFKPNLKNKVRRMSRIQRLESKVRKLTRFANYMAKEFAEVNVWANMQNKAYSLTVETTHQLLYAFDNKQDQIDRLKQQVQELLKNKTAQGGVSRVSGGVSTSGGVSKDEQEEMPRSKDESDDDVIVCEVNELPGSSSAYQDPVRRSSRRKKDD